MKRLNKINKKILFVLILFISIGFAYLTRDLTLSGISSIFRNTWDVHFDNVVVSEGSVEAETPVIDTNKTSVSFSVEFSTPGDFYEFTVDAVNGGTIDAMLNTFTSSELDESVTNLLEYTVTYADGEELAQYQELNAGDSLTYKIRLYYKLDISEDDLPDSNIPVEITFTTDYIQADSNRIRRRAENTLYNVLKTEAESGGLAKKYTGAHQDSMDASKSTKDIYHWYADNDTDGTAVTNKNNVIFANHCWQLIRTTDTGGAKLLYNGEVENNQCLDTRGNHIGYSIKTTQNLSTTYYYGTSYNYNKTNNKFTLSGNVSTGDIYVGEYTCKSTDANGECDILYYVYSLYYSTTYNVIPIRSNSKYSKFGDVVFNDKSNSLSNIGYMYNKSYPSTTVNLYNSEYICSDSGFNSYYFSNSYTYTPGNYYQLTNATSYSSYSEDLIGQYTLNNFSPNASSRYMDYIAKSWKDPYRGWNLYTFRLTNGDTLEQVNYSYIYGDSYTDNGDGTYTINNPSSTDRIGLCRAYNKVKNKYVCKNAVNNSCEDIWYVVDETETNFIYLKSSNLYKYSSGYSYDGNKYTLDNNNSVSFWNFSVDNNSHLISDAHYTCWNSSGECFNISYIYSCFNISEPSCSYLNLSNNIPLNDYINEMISDSNLNVKDSTIKFLLGLWYEKYLVDYSDYLEDTIYCNNRNIKSFGGLNPNGGSIYSTTYFDSYSSNDLSCPNIGDKFSTSNEHALLNYNIGLMSYPEMNLLGNNNIRKAGGDYWLISPSGIYINTSVFYINTSGDFVQNKTSYSSGLRPSISVNPGVFYSSGDGSKENPYIIYTN